MYLQRGSPTDKSGVNNSAHDGHDLIMFGNFTSAGADQAATVLDAIG